jgi:hypothetical protein
MDRIGLDFTLLDIEGRPFHASLLLGRPTILVLLRHLGCLFCQQHLAELRKFTSEIDQTGGQVAVVSFAPHPHLAGFAEALGYPYVWLSDPDRASYRAFDIGRGGLLNPFSPTDLWRAATGLVRGKPWIPQQRDIWQLGADFVFDPDGMLTMAHQCQSSHDRPPVADVIAAYRLATRGAAAVGF